MKFEPMNPAPPVTNRRISRIISACSGSSSGLWHRVIAVFLVVLSRREHPWGGLWLLGRQHDGGLTNGIHVPSARWTARGRSDRVHPPRRRSRLVRGGLQRERFHGERDRRDVSTGQPLEVRRAGNSPWLALPGGPLRSGQADPGHGGRDL